MKKLVAKKPIQYGGRMYAPGERIPAHDAEMVAAWLKAGTAEWAGGPPAPAAPQQADEGQANEIADALTAMGVSVTHADGSFVGADVLADSLRAVFAPIEPGNADSEAQGSTTPESGTLGAQERGADTETVTGKLDAEEMAKTMNRDALDKMATDMGLDISACKNKLDIAKLIAAVPVQAPAPENGGGAL